VGDPVVVGSGLTVGGAVVCDPLGTGEVAGVPEPLGVIDGLADGDRDGLGDVGTGLGDAVGDELDWEFDLPMSAFSDAVTGRTRMYSASTATNRLEMTRVEIRGRPLMRHLRWPGRY